MASIIHEYSAGGIVYDEAQVVMIRTRTRSGRAVWTFPKGRIEPGETPQQAALREVREETGYTGTLKHPLGTTTYWYRRSGARVYKRVEWFLLTPKGEPGCFDREEVDEVRRVPLHEAYDKLAHRGDRRLLSRAEELISV